MFVYRVCLACHGRSFDAILMPFHKQTEKCLQNVIRFEIAFLVTEWLEKRSVCTGPDYDEKKTQQNACLFTEFVQRVTAKVFIQFQSY